MYECNICGEKHNNLKDYMNCVQKCGEREIARLKLQEEQKKNEEINAALNKVKSALAYYEECLADLKERFPEAYELNFGVKTGKTKVCNTDNESCDAKKNPKSFSQTVEIEARHENGKDPDVKMKVNGKDVDWQYTLNNDDFVSHVMDMLRL